MLLFNQITITESQDMQNPNPEFQELIDYLTEIMHKLQDQSDILRGENFAICLTNDKKYTDNAFINYESNTIMFGLKYLERVSRHSEDAVAQIIAHELSHSIFKRTKSVSAAHKEEEIFADNYGLILCNRAGYNYDDREWNIYSDTDIINKDEHPHKKIRRIINRRTISRLKQTSKGLTPFRLNIPSANNFKEYYTEFMLSNIKNSPIQACILSSDIGIYENIKHKKEYKNGKHTKEYKQNTKKLKALLKNEKLDISAKNAILNLDSNLCDLNLFQDLYQKIKDVPELHNNEEIQLFCHSILIKNNIMRYIPKDDPNLFPEIFKLEKILINKFDKMQNIEQKYEFAKQYLAVNHRFQSPENRQKIFSAFALGLQNCYGKDNSSDSYAQQIEEEVKNYDSAIHNADVIPLIKAIAKSLEVGDKCMSVLQNFAKRNSYEIEQIRAEILISECLLNPKQALETLKFLTDNSMPSFQTVGIYDQESGKEEPSYIDEEELENIRHDWSNISPTKRADIFALLMENVSPDNVFNKLDLFVEKKDKKDPLYKSVLNSYIQTYTEEQRPYVVATLVSQKDPNRPYSYEDYFKTVLLNSGTMGRKVHNQIYGSELPEEFSDIHRPYLPIYSDGDIIFANLHKLGINLKKLGDKDLKKLGNQITNVTTKHLALIKNKQYS